MKKFHSFNALLGPMAIVIGLIGPQKNESNNFFCIFSSFSWFFMLKFEKKRPMFFRTDVSHHSYPDLKLKIEK